MKEYISSFLEEKELAENSRLAYLYDLQQFAEVCQENISQAKLAIYQASLQEFKPAVQRRKLSAVNQFLFFLYEKNYLDRFYKLKSSSVAKISQSKQPKKTEDTASLWNETIYPKGQLIALLILTLGLIPSEIALIRQENLDLSFQILTLENEKGKRIMNLPKDLIPYLENQLVGTYLFDKKGQSYSRQWFFNRLSEFVTSIGHKTWTAQYLRDQYIIAQLELGLSVDDLAKQLGLSSQMGLEKYR